MIKLLIGIILIIMTGCGEQKPCAGPFPDHTYFAGERATFKPTGEVVRISAIWVKFGGSRCKRRKYGEYTIRFHDGATVDTTWKNLQPFEVNKS